VKYHITVDGRPHEVEVVERLGELVVSLDGQVFDARYLEVDDLGQVVILHEGRSYGLSIEGDANQKYVTLAGHVRDVRIEDEREKAARAAERARNKGGGAVLAVMPGVVVELLVQKGARVRKGEPLLVLSAMKMQNEIASPVDGVVVDVHVAAGQAVAGGAKLATLKADEVA
jgi:biotin carboxyl carrier protein